MRLTGRDGWLGCGGTLHVAWNLSPFGVSFGLTFGESKANPVTDYKSVIAQALTEDNAWKAPHAASIRARAAMLGLYTQCLDAVAQAREQGTAIDLKEIAVDKMDAIEIGYRGKAIGFCRIGSDVIRIIHRGFPAVLFIGPHDRMLELPMVPTLANEWARAHVTDALTVLVKAG